LKALVLEEARQLALRDIDLPLEVGPRDVQIKIHTVGVCGSDVHYYTHGRIGPFKVEAPMVLGHEASGTVVETGSEVTHLHVGDRVCMEPGVPQFDSPATMRGLYNLDPAVRFWATPPIHGCLTPYVVHPAAFTFRLPDNVSFAEGAIVEPLSIGLQAAKKASMKPGDVAVVIKEKLALFAGNPAVTTVDVREQRLSDVVREVTTNWGADVVFEASGNARVYDDLFDLLCPGGCAVLVGMPVDRVPLDVVAMQAKEARLESVFRYANVFPRALALISSGMIDVKPFISRKFAFADGLKAFEEAAAARPHDVKIQIEMD
jgi:D-xylulose reductase